MAINFKRIPTRERAADQRNKDFLEVNLGFNEQEAVEEAKRCIQCKNRPCVGGCPVEVPIPEFIKLVAEGKFAEAIAKNKEKNNLPGICGRVCPQEEQCEKKCTVGVKGDAVSIGKLERFVADWELAHGVAAPEKAPPNGKKVAVIGCGPAGLTCAGDLAKIGYQVTIFEALHKPGGVLSYGIPPFRLPRNIIASEVDYVRKLGVEIKLDHLIGQLITIKELFETGYSAVFIGSGAGLPSFMNIPGINSNGVFSANEYLTRVNLMNAAKFPEFDTPVWKGKSVAVVGCGNVAMDSVRTAKRLGADRAMIVYRRSVQEMTARVEEYHHAQEEGIEFLWLTNPIEILFDDKKTVTGIKVQKQQLCEPDESGRCKPEPIPGSEYVIDVDTVIMALGTSPNPLISRTTPGLDVGKWGTINVDDKQMTSIPGVFAGGDAATGAATVILAMGAGKVAARAIDEYVKSKG